MRAPFFTQLKPGINEKALAGRARIELMQRHLFSHALRARDGSRSVF
jgi:hypothetical protein